MTFNISGLVMKAMDRTSQVFLPWKSHDSEQIMLPNDTGGVPIVVSGGGFYGPVHVGFRRRLKELGIKLGPEVGCSIGCWDMYMAKNGFTEDEVVDAYVNELSHPDMQAVLRGLMVPFWKPGMAMMRKVAQLLPVIRDLSAAEGNRSVVAGILECLGLIDIAPFCVDFVKRHNIQPWDDIYTYTFDLLNWEPYVFAFKTADQGKPGEQERMGIALAAASAVAGAVRPVFYIDENGKHRLLIDGGFWHDGKGGLFEEPTIVSQLLDIKGMRVLYPHDRKDIVVKCGMPGSRVFEPLSPEQVRERIEWGYQQTVDNEQLNRLVREGSLPLNG